MNFSLSVVWSLYAFQSDCTAFDAAAGFAETDFGAMRAAIATWLNGEELEIHSCHAWPHNEPKQILASKEKTVTSNDRATAKHEPNKPSLGLFSRSKVFWMLTLSPNASLE